MLRRFSLAVVAEFVDAALAAADSGRQKQQQPEAAPQPLATAAAFEMRCQWCMCWAPGAIVTIGMGLPGTPCAPKREHSWKHKPRARGANRGREWGAHLNCFHQYRSRDRMLAQWRQHGWWPPARANSVPGGGRRSVQG